LDNNFSWFKHTKADSLGAAGIQTAGLSFWWSYTPTPPGTAATEEYNGTTWTSNPTGLNTVRRILAGCGTQTAALAFGGGPPNTGATEEYNGSTWTQSYFYEYSKK
jgi:hypothetical protein